jgi:signal transduction histidine kinase
MLFKNKSVRYIFFITLAVGILIPLFNIYFIYPLFTDLLMKNTQEDALRTATYFTSMFKKEFSELTQDSISPDVIKKIYKFKVDFHFTKLKIFSKNGEVIYSTEPQDKGQITLKPFFFEKVAKGIPYSQIMKKGEETDGKEALSYDVVQTYIPIMNNNTFIGAFDIYHDITDRSRSLKKVVFKASFIPFAMMLGGLTLTIIILIQYDKSITRQKKADEELKDYAKRLRHSNRELESFAHIASHDLQEPLRKVIAFGERLSSKYADKIDEQGRDYLRRMSEASRRMQNLINSLLTFSRVTTKAQPFTPVDMNQIAQDVLSDLEVGIERSGAHIEINNLTTIEADPLQMRQLLQNLIGNALKFAKNDTPPKIKIQGEIIHPKHGTTAVNGDFFQLTVQDNGIGFEEKYAERIFDVFQRLHGRNEYEGSGIGLSICRRIVDRHHGKIKAKSAPGKGSTFTITLPIKQKKGGDNGNQREVNNHPDG